ncbi:36328_t:CDS:1, partial [Racocetra persica]
ALRARLVNGGGQMARGAVLKTYSQDIRKKLDENPSEESSKTLRINSNLCRKGKYTK